MHHPRRDCLYLSGSIEFNKDPDTWREEMRNTLKHKLHVIIPWASTPPAKKGTPEYAKWIHENFVIPDMSDVARSKYFFIKIDKGVLKGAGTISELSLAAWMNRDIVAMLDGLKLEELPGWMLGCLAKAHMVVSIEEAIEYYKSLDIEPDEDEQCESQ